jgi:peptidoglycan/xylan/chitin deacetylase (PgdA/CDA1 family)
MLKRAARTAFHSLRGISAFRRFNRSGVRIVMYHHFSSGVENLKQQCEHIRRFYHPVALRDVANSWLTGEPLPSNSVAVTIDDGYRNFLTGGYPVFRAFDIPSTMFLVSDFLDCKAWLWWDVVEYTVEHTRRQSLTLETADGSSHSFAFSVTGGHGAAQQQICDLLKKLPNEERLRLLAEIVESLEVEIPARPPSKHEPLAWSEVRQLAGDSVEFGAHTKTHPILSRISDRETLHEEIVIAKSRIEHELEQPVIHFCYPNGRFEDFTEAAVDLISAAGFKTAVTTERGINFPGAPPFMLKRLGADPDTPMPYFSELLAGVRRQ